MIKHYFTLAIRQLTKDKTRTLVSILGLAAGLLCFGVCNYYYRIMSAGNTSFSTYDRLAELKIDNRMAGFPMDYWQKIGKEEFEDVAFFSNMTMNVTMNENILCRTKATRCNKGYFHVFPANLVAGSVDRFDIGQQVAVVTTNFVRNFCGNINPIDQTLELARGEKLSIIAVIEPYPAGMNSYPVVYDVFVPFSSEREIYGQHKLLLHRPEDAARITQRLPYLKLNPRHPEQDNSYRIALDSETSYKSGIELWIGVIGVLVLLVGLINFYSLNIHSFLSRTRELAMRYTLGGRKRNLFAMLYIEQSILLVVATLLALAVSETVLPSLINAMPVEVREELAINTSRLCLYILQYLCGLLILSALVVFASIGIAQTLIQGVKGVGKSGRSNHIGRNVSLGLQFIFSMFFIIATVAAHLQMQALSERANPGMTAVEKQLVLSVDILMYPNLKNNLPSIKHKIESCPWYASMTLKGTDYLSYDNMIEVVLAPDSYFEMMNLDKKHHDGEPFCYVNSILYEEMAADSAPGLLSYNNQEYPIMGITPISATGSNNIKRVAILPLTDEKESSELFVKILPDADRTQVQKDMATILNPYLPVNTPWNYTTLYDEQCNVAVRILMWLFVVCAVICLLVTVMGIYGAITIDTRKRQKEVAIRKVNGATLRHIYWLFGRTYTLIYLVASILTVSLCLAGLIMGKQSKVLLIDYTLPELWIAPLFLSALIMALTICWRIYKISITNPSEVIAND